ncbi:MAG: NAD(P)-dependent alcohol dehydrogenase [Kangiellaceae bacterium]|nr:NAD(P)-dependent alcohol dehydrogenase [Kangiellaceae bacterium]
MCDRLKNPQGTFMKAVICTKYGSPEVLQIRQVEKPIPKNNEVLIKIYATTVHIGDTKIRSFKPGMGFFLDLLVKPMMRIMIGFRGPRKKILGMELAGKIETVGKNVTLFRQGDKVFASTELRFGTYAQYICLPENGLIAPLPTNATYEEASPVPNGALTALLLFKKGTIQKDQRVLVYGASGSVGTFAVQLAKYFETHVTGVCSTANLEMVKSLGADKVTDYTQENFTKNNVRYDIVFDAVGKLNYSDCKQSLKKNGVYLDVLTSSSGLKLKSVDLRFLKELIEAGKLRAVIDKIYTLDQIVEAHSYVDKGHKKGNVVIAVKHDKKT